MTAFPQYFGWLDDDFVPIEQPNTTELEVADSWRVHEGITWGLEDHVQRFMVGIEQQNLNSGLPRGLTAQQLHEALQRKLSEISAAHPGVDLFPRISAESHEASWRIILLVRPAPEPRRTTSLWIPNYTDPRTRPTVKGPDIHLMRGLVDEAPADDVLLHDGTNVHETTTGALLVWHTPEHLVLCQASKQLASISAQRIANHARSLNIDVTTRLVAIQELASGKYPVWFSNTLHGISPVSSVGSATGETQVKTHQAAAQWQTAWWAMFAV